jgi:hypothetical protein
MRVSGRKDLLFALVRERRPVAVDRAVPGERVGDRLLDRTEDQARRERLRDVGARHPCMVAAGEPERKLRPRLDAGIEHALLVDPDEVGVGARRRACTVEQRCKGQRLRGTGRVERAAGTLERKLDEPRREVARIHELDGRVRVARPEHCTAACDPPRPVREAVGRVVRADDQARAYARAPVAIGLLDDAFARSLERAVVLQHLLARRVGELRDRCRFADRLAEVVVHGDARDEDVAADLVA